MARTNNPLDKYVTTKPGNWARDFKVPMMPKLRDAISGANLLDGATAHDQSNEEWRKNLEQSLSERMRQAEAAATAATTTTSAIASAPAASVSSPSTPLGVSSVNGRVGAVVITSDDVPVGLVNLYLTQSAWLAMFDALGFHENHIMAGEAVQIPAARNLVMTGPLTIDGSLQIDGYLRML